MTNENLDEIFRKLDLLVDDARDEPDEVFQFSGTFKFSCDDDLSLKYVEANDYSVNRHIRDRLVEVTKRDNGRVHMKIAVAVWDDEDQGGTQ